MKGEENLRSVVLGRRRGPGGVKSSTGEPDLNGALTSRVCKSPLTL